MVRIDAEPPRTPWALPVLVGVVVAGLVVWRTITGRDAPPTPSAPAASETAETTAPKPPALPRCAGFPADPFVIGEPSKHQKSAPPPDPSAAPAGDPPEEPEDELAPFAVEIGRGSTFEGGFAAGARRDAEGGAIAMVVTLGPDGKDGKLVKLGRSRGDLDPPIVTGAGGAVLAAMLEPNAGGRSIKIAKVKGGEVTWGVELSEGRDESMVMDLAATGERALVVWDAVPRDAERSSVMLASFDVATMRSVTAARPVSAPKADAEAPRLVPRPGGYWLGYLARAEEHEKKKEKKRSDDEKDWEEKDDDQQGESILNRWVEVMPLDENGAPTAAARAVTPKGGHALAFDLEIGEDGGAIVAWRDDDTPTGSTGGRLLSVLVRLGGVGEARVLSEDTGGAGVPDLLPGWISLASVSGATRFAAVNARGELVDELAPEPSLGGGEPIAATRDAILWARPAGKAMRLGVIRCAPRANANAPSAATPDAGR